MKHRSVSFPESPLNTHSFLRRARARFVNPAIALAAGVTLFAGHAAQAANTEYDVNKASGTDLTAAATYTTGGTAGTGVGGTAATTPPSLTSDVTFDSGTYTTTAFTIPTAITFGSLNDLSTTALTISNSTGMAASTLTLGGAGDPGSSVPGSAVGDLLFVATGSNLTINSGAAGTATALNLALGQSGNFDVVGTAAISSIISDGGAGFGITKTGAGTLTLSGVNTYTGATSVTGGTLNIAAESSLGAAPASFVANQLTLDNGAKLVLTTSGNTFSANRGITIGANGGTISSSSSNVQNVKFQAPIAGTGVLTLSPNGTGTRAFTLSGNNTFGGLIVTGQEVDAASSTALGAGSVQLGATNGATTTTINLTAGGLNVANAINVAAGGTRSLGLNSSGGTGTFSGAISLTGGTINPTLNLAQLNINSTLNITGGITGTGNVAFAGGIGNRTNSNITISGAAVNNVGTLSNLPSVSTGVNTISANIGSNVTSVIQNTTNSSLVLTGANTYTGTTVVTLGTLLYNGSVGTTATPAGAVTVANGGTAATSGTLGGTGILTVASATINGTVAPGATTGATTGALTLNTTSGTTITGTLAIGITATGSSTLTTTGGLTLGTGSILTVTGTSGRADYDIANYTTGSLTGTFGTLNIPSGYVVNYAGTDFGGSGINEIELVAVPEPSTWVAGLTCFGMMGAWLSSVRRKSRRGVQAAA